MSNENTPVSLDMLIAAYNALTDDFEILEKSQSGLLVTTSGRYTNQITPTVGGASQPKQTIGGTSITAITKLIVSVNGNDDVADGARLYNEHPDVYVVPINELNRIPVSSNVTRVAVVALVSATSSGAGSKVSGDSEATVRGNMVLFEFDSADKVREIEIGAFVPLATGTEGEINCMGFA